MDVGAGRARDLGVDVRTRSRVRALPDAPVIVATDPTSAQQLLPDRPLSWPGGHTLCLDLGLVSGPGDPLIVHDLDTAGWIERFTAADRSLAPDGHEVIQAQMPIGADGDTGAAETRLERLLDASVERWRGRVTWRRRLVMRGRTGALDPPGTTWSDRPAVDQGAGVFLAGDTVAAPGLLCEVAHHSAVSAARRAARLDGPASAATRAD